MTRHKKRAGMEGDDKETKMEKITVKKGCDLEDCLDLTPAPFDEDEPYAGEVICVEYE